MVGWLFGSFVVLLLIGTPIAASLGLAAVITIVMSGMQRQHGGRRPDDVCRHDLLSADGDSAVHPLR